MTTTQNMNLELLEGTDNFNTDSIKSNFEKIDEQTLIPTKIVDNCVTDNNNLPLSAKQGKELQDQITQLNGNLSPSFERLGIFDIATNYENAEPEGNSYYTISGNICIVNLNINCVTPSSGVHNVFSVPKLPKPSNGVYAFGALAANVATSDSVMFCGVRHDGHLFFKRGVAGVQYTGQFCYII